MNQKNSRNKASICSPYKVMTVFDMFTIDSIIPEQDAQPSQKDRYTPFLEDLDDIAIGHELFILFDNIQQSAFIADELVVFRTKFSVLDLI